MFYSKDNKPASRMIPRLATGFFAVWVIYAVVSLALTIGFIAVAIHFIAKFW